MIMRLQFFLAGLMLIFCSCNAEDEPIQERIETVTVASGSLYGAGEEGIQEGKLVIDDVDAWNAMLSNMNTVNNESGNFLETDIDFSSYQVIAVFEEVKGNGGYSLGINVFEDSANRIVKVESHVPEGNATRVITQPYIIVRIPRSTLPIVFQ